MFYTPQRRASGGGTASANYSQVTTARDPQNLRFHLKTHDSQKIRKIDMNKLDLDATDIMNLPLASDHSIVAMNTMLK